MANPSKQKGTKGETSVVKYLKSFGIQAERKALSGSNDQGDIKVIEGGTSEEWILEVKAGKQTYNPSRAQLEEWFRQTVVEAENAGVDWAALVVVRYRRSIKDADVYILRREGFDTPPIHRWLDEFILWLK